MKVGDLVSVTKMGITQVGVLIKLPTEKYMAAGRVGQVLVDGVLHYANEEQIEFLGTGGPSES